MEKQFEYDGLPIVEVRQGKLRGYQSEGTYIFKGIPYAKARRFHAPKAPDKWEGVKEAFSYGFVSPMLTQDTPNGELLVPHRYWPMDEHCQNLNIWTQDLSGKRPVLVWLHGGGFSMGSSIEQKAYNGANLSRVGNVVVVSVNHRLNILGYFDLSPYGKEYANSANAGQDDIIAALRWIRENISSFGGDPDNVTIFGQSGGGAKVSALMQMPAADGLFHKGIIMSGVLSGLMEYSTGDSRPIVKAVLKELGLTEKDVKKLEKVPYHDLAKAYNKVSTRIKAKGGYVGCEPKRNAFYKGEGPDVGFTDHAKTIPVLVSSVFGEFNFMPLPVDKAAATKKETDAALAARLGSHAKKLSAEYAKAYPGKHPADLLSLDTLFRTPSKRFIRSFAEQGGTVWSYLFTLEFPFQHGKAAWHCSDIPFLFHNTPMVPVCSIPGVTEKLEDQMAKALLAFAETGDPNHGGIPAWPASTADAENTMIFDRTCEVRVNHDNKLLELILEAGIKPVLPVLSEDIQH